MCSCIHAILCKSSFNELEQCKTDVNVVRMFDVQNFLFLSHFNLNFNETNPHTTLRHTYTEL